MNSVVVVHCRFAAATIGTAIGGLQCRQAWLRGCTSLSTLVRRMCIRLHGLHCLSLPIAANATSCVSGGFGEPNCVQ